MKPFIHNYNGLQVNLWAFHRSGANRNPLTTHVVPIPVRLWVR